MKKNVIINMINKFYLNLSDKSEATQAINLLKNPEKDNILTRIMKKQWNRIDNDGVQKKQDLNKKTNSK